MTKDVRVVIERLEETLRVATLANDVATTDALLADDWLNINANGTLTTKEQSLNVMPNFRFISVRNEEVKIRTYPNLAIVTGVSTRELAMSEAQTKISKVLFTRVYAFMDERWQLVTSQATPASQDEH